MARIHLCPAVQCNGRQSRAQLWLSSSVPLDESGLDGSGGWDDYYPEINFYLNSPKCYRSYCTYYDTLKLLNTTTKTYNAGSLELIR
jgi:hypothetical protein